MSCGLEYRCGCGDRLIHQENRGLHESSSAFGQAVHNNYPRRFFFGDLDAYLLRRPDQYGHGCLRLFEVKPPNGSISLGQRNLLPLLAKGVAHAIQGTEYDADPSGVYVLNWKPGTEHALVTEYLPGGGTRQFEVEGELFRLLVTGQRRHISELVKAA